MLPVQMKWMVMSALKMTAAGKKSAGSAIAGPSSAALRLVFPVIWRFYLIAVPFMPSFPRHLVQKRQIVSTGPVSLSPWKAAF